MTMSYRGPRKRRRSKAFPKKARTSIQQDEATMEDDAEVMTEKLEGEEPQADVQEVSETAQKEHEIWEAFREENYESMIAYISIIRV